MARVDTHVLVVNAGSSSLKLRVLGGPGAGSDEVTGAADLAAVGGALGGGADGAAIKEAIESFGPVDAVGHRVVHGGTLYAAPVLVTAEVRRRLESLTDLAPLHQPKSLAALDAVTAVLPDTPAVACFDTAFHATIPEAAATFALPAEWRARWTLRRYGFHGLSHAYASAAGRRSSPGTLARRAGRAAGRHLPPGRGRVARGGARGPLGGHHHGVHPARRPGDGDQVGLGGPGPRAVA